MQLNPRGSQARRQRGLSLIELMVGITIGLIISAAAALMMTNQVVEHTRMMRETQLQQDLRAAGDLMLRDLRRSGFWATPENGVWAPGQTVTSNFYAPVSPDANTAQVLYAYSQSDVYTKRLAGTTPEVTGLASNASFGFRINNGVLQSLNGATFTVNADGAFQLQSGTWQPLTDSATLVVDPDSFSITQNVQKIDLGGFCSPLCDSTISTCPTQVVRRFDITLRASATSDPTVVRSLNIQSRSRNDQVIGACP